MERHLVASSSMQAAIEPSISKDESAADQNEEPPSPSYKSNMPSLLVRLWADVTQDQWNDWRWQFKNRLRSLKELSSLLGLKSKELGGFKKLFETYRFSATPYWLSLINWNDPFDPIFRQCIPDMAEIECCEAVSGDAIPKTNLEDPLEEEEDSQVPGLVHRYPDRVLAVVTNLCSMYCRHCTRKRAWHEPEAEKTYHELQRMIDYVAATPKVREVIVSGGDPLTMNMDKLDWFLGALQSIPHVEVLRIGTRIPSVLPMRITDELCAMLGRHRPLWLNTQFNHPNEITPEAARACDRLLKTGIPVSNQTVLLRGINDSPQVMKDLCHALQRIMVRPYYLFECDPVKGAEHFRTSIWTGVNIIESMRGHTGGLCIPTFVVDAIGGGGKVPLQPFYLLSATDDEVVFRNYEGLIIRYPNPHPDGGVSKSQTAQSTSSAHAGERYRRRRLKARKGDLTCV